mgnify:CR=1 FL=1
MADDVPDVKIDIAKNIDASDIDFQKFITDPKSMKLYFYSALAGWRIYQRQETKEILDMQQIIDINSVDVDKNSRICNETGADYAFSAMYPLISEFTATSKIAKSNIYNQYRTTIKEIANGFLVNYYIDGNSYSFKPYRIGELVSFLCRFELISLKGLEGFTLKELRETIMSGMFRRENYTPEAPDNSLGAKLKRAFNI